MATAALRAKEGGLDGLEVICSTHLPDQFWSPAMNRRTDGYGGSLANRIRFSWRCSRPSATRSATDYIVGIRMSGDEMLEGGLTPEESLEIAVRHARARPDRLHQRHRRRRQRPISASPS